TAYYRGSSQALLAHGLAATDPAAGREAAALARQCLSPDSVEAQELTTDERAWIRLDAARIALLLDEPDAAIRYCTEALRLDLAEKERVASLTVLSEALGAAQRFGEAAEALTSALAQTSHHPGLQPRLWLGLGIIQLAGGKPADAREALLHALETGRL